MFGARGENCDIQLNNYVHWTELGYLGLGSTEQAVRAAVGTPASVQRGFRRHCVRHGGSLLLGQRGDRCGTNYEGLYCVDGSIVPTSLGVNPSLTISALSEGCAQRLVARRADLGLPHRPRHWPAGVPPRHIGRRVVPAHA